MISIFSAEEKKKERTLPPPDLFAACPYGGNILDFYNSQFESVYVLLHPFISAVSIDDDLFYPGTYPSKLAILEHCTPVEWREVVSLTSLPDINAVDMELRTGILGLDREYSNPQYAESINKLEETTNIVRSSEGDIPGILQNRLFYTVQSVGQNWLWVGDEFGTERKLEWVDDLKGEYPFPPHFNLFTPDRTILLTTHWDSHFSFLCSSRKMIETILSADQFEGFFCTKATEVYWSLNSPVTESQVLSGKRKII